MIKKNAYVNSLISVILLPQVQLRSLNNPPVIPAKQNHIPKQLMPFYAGKGSVPQSNSKSVSNMSMPHDKENIRVLDPLKKEPLASAKSAQLLPVITISVPQEEQKRRPDFAKSGIQLAGLRERHRRDDMLYLKGSRSQGCSPERQSKLETKCFSSPHIPAGKPPLPPPKVKMNFQENGGQKGRKYLSSHAFPNVIAPSRSAPSLARYDNLDLSVSFPGRNVKAQGYQKKHHASLESLLDHTPLPTGMRQPPMQRKIIGRSMDELPSASLGLSPHSSHLNMSGLEPLSSSIRSSSLNALSFSSNSGLIQSSNACHSKSSAGTVLQGALGSFSSSSCSSKPFPKVPIARRAAGLQVKYYPSLSSSTPDLRDAGRHHFKQFPVG